MPRKLKRYYQPQTPDTPEIILDVKKEKFSFTGESFPENVFAVYDPVMQWFKEYLAEPWENLTVEINMPFINSSSSRFLADIFQLFEKQDDCERKFLINWYYDQEDEEALIEGHMMQEVCPVLTFNFIPFNS